MRAGVLLPALALGVLLTGGAATAATPPASTRGADTGFQDYLEGNYERALRELMPLAKAGYAPAQYTLGQIYDNGTGTAPDKAQAAKWYRRAARQGYVPAEERLGLMYARGTGVPKDLERAYRWLDKAAAGTSGEHQAMIEDERYRVVVQMTPRQLMETFQVNRDLGASAKTPAPPEIARSKDRRGARPVG
jgi:TPR repeat protein